MQIMINNISDYLLLLQINDATFPIGSYTHSYGLETYVQQRLVYNISSFKSYIQQNIQNNLLYNDFLAVALAYDAAFNADNGAIVELDEILSAVKIASETRIASNKLASRFIKTVAKFNLDFKTQNFQDYSDLISNSTCAGHHALTYGVFCGALNLDKNTTIINFAYGQISSIVNNGVKLIPLSQTLGQQLLQEIQLDLSAALQKLNSLTIADLGRSTPLFELRSMQHEVLYSRLYMS